MNWLPPALLVLLAGLVWQQGSNQALFLQLNAAAQALPATLWSALTLLGTGACAYALIAHALVRAPRLIGAALLTGAFAGLYTHAIKRIVQAARPAAVLPLEQFHIIGETLSHNAFPSGHSVTAFAFAGVLVCFARRPLAMAALCLPLAALVAFSRIAVGAHWPLDVLAGAAGGWLCGVAGEAASRRLLAWGKRRWQIAFAMAYVVMGLALASSDLGYPLALPLQWLLAALACLGGLYALWQHWRQRGHAA